MLNNLNWNACGSGISAKGADPIKRFVSAGGGLVTGEWLLWNSDLGGRHQALEPLLPADVSASAGTTSATYTQVTADAVLNDSLPASFDFPLGNYAGSESTLDPKSDATLFYESSNSGANMGGVVGWGYNGGRVISLSTLISSVELGDADYERLFVSEGCPALFETAFSTSDSWGLRKFLS